jgi:hypothetical protein
MCFACFHTHLKYGITVWGSDPQSRKIFLLQKKVIRIMCKVNQHTSCRNLFRMLSILPLPCIYISEMVCWIKYYRGNLEYNSDVHDYDTCYKTDLHLLAVRTNRSLLHGYIMMHGPQNIKSLFIVLLRLCT